MDLSTALMITGGAYVFLRFASHIPYPRNKIYGLSNFGTIVLTIFIFGACCLRMCEDQHKLQRFAERSSFTEHRLNEIKRLREELERLDPSRPDDRERLKKITQRIDELRAQIDEDVKGR